MELPLTYFEKSSLTNPLSKFMSSSEIRSVIEKHSGIKFSQQKLSVAMRKLGYEKSRKEIDGNKVNGFYVIPRKQIYQEDEKKSENIAEEIEKNKIQKLPF
jgi:arginine repressor